MLEAADEEHGKDRGKRLQGVLVPALDLVEGVGVLVHAGNSIQVGVLDVVLLPRLHHLFA